MKFSQGNIIVCLLLVSAIAAFFCMPAVSLAASVITVQQVASEFEKVFGKKPTTQELDYWKSRRDDKKTIEALRGAMASAKAKKQTTGTTATSSGNAIAKDVPIAFKQVFGRLPNKTEKVWWSDRATCGNFKKYSDMLVSMKFHKSQKVTMGTGGKAQFCAPKSTSGSLKLNSGLALGSNKSGPVVKIGIWVTKQAIQISSSGKFTLQHPDVKKTFNDGEVVKVSLSGDKYVVTGPNNFKKTLEGPVKFVPGSGAIMEIVNYSDKGASGTNYNKFRGNIIVNKDSAGRGIWAINELHAEDYVRGLGETSDNAPTEFQKALAVAARTYVLNHHVLGGRQPQNGFDITNTPNDQWYRGYNYEKIVPEFANSVRNTVGQVLTYSGKLIASLYFSGSDGRTRSAKEVWNSSKFPYLQGKPDPYGGKTLRGHGVGLSGDGAVNYARKENWDYKKILNYYYTNIKLERGY